jgi:hypothetical protein
MTPHGSQGASRARRRPGPRRTGGQSAG